MRARAQRDDGRPRLVPLIGLFLLGALLCAAPLQAATLKNVLVIFSSTRLSAANNELATGLRKRLLDATDHKITLFEEFLDQGAFAGPDFEATFQAYLRSKYTRHPPDAVVVVGRGALDFLLRHRGTLFTDVAAVHLAVDELRIQEIGALPANVLGSPAVYDITGSIRLALRLHPNTKRIIVVTGASHRDRQWEADARATLARLHDLPQVEFLAGLSTAALVDRLRRLGDADIVYTPGFFSDGAGRTMSIDDAARIISTESRAPVYGPFAVFVGLGVVGGSTVDFVELGRQAGNTVNALFGGDAPTSVRAPAAVTPRFEVDWRQLRRWGIAESALPDGSILRFKEPSLWEQQRLTVLVTLSVIALQFALIAALLIERRRRRATASALDESERRMSLAARAAGLTLWIWDAARDKVRTHARRQPPGGAATEVPSDFDRVLQTVHPADREDLERSVRTAAASREELDVEYRVLGPDGEVRWIAARGRTTDDGSHLTGVALDVTARKAAELQGERDRAALTHMTRVSTMGQLSASIAHQLNQPLTAILGNAEVARKMLDHETLDRTELAEICDDIVAEDQRASEIIGRLTALFRRGDMKFVPFDLNELVLETLELVRTELLVRHVAPVIELAPALHEVEGDRIQLQQVLLNLVMNGAEAMKHAPVSRRRLVIRTALDGERCRLCVADNGTGISPDAIKNMFSAFWTTKASGVGVGLAVSQSIMNAHEGSITVVNNPEGGATFCVTWPARRHDPRWVDVKLATYPDSA